MPKSFMRTRSPFFRMLVSLATKSVSRLRACAWLRSVPAPRHLHYVFSAGFCRAAICA
jgi:hypothetical protein